MQFFFFQLQLRSLCTVLSPPVSYSLTLRLVNKPQSACVLPNMLKLQQSLSFSRTLQTEGSSTCFLLRTNEDLTLAVIQDLSLQWQNVPPGDRLLDFQSCARRWLAFAPVLPPPCRWCMCVCSLSRLARRPLASVIPPLTKLYMLPLRMVEQLSPIHPVSHVWLIGGCGSVSLITYCTRGGGGLNANRKVMGQISQTH